MGSRSKLLAFVSGVIQGRWALFLFRGTVKYLIQADEAWTHNSPPLRRYWCFFGGIMGLESDVDQLTSGLEALRQNAGSTAEVGWKSCAQSSATTELWKSLVSHLLQALPGSSLRFRQFFTSREFVYEATPGDPVLSALDVQFRLYYQYLKHCFDISSLPPASASAPHEISIQLDRHSSQAHKDRLQAFAEKHFDRQDVTSRLGFVDSNKHLAIQVCDLIAGAAGSYGNKMHDLRPLVNGKRQRGMTKKQRRRHELAQHCYNEIRALDAQEHGSQAFNWFESTGRAKHHGSFAIWKFKPRRYQLDRGWQNDHLDREGNYQGAQLSGDVYSR